MPRAGVYVRISSDPEGLAAGVERQEKDARKLAKSNGWEVVDLYRDNDVSASGKRRRPEWERLLNDLAAGRIDAVTAYSSSRMYRRPADLQRLIDLAKTKRIEIATVASGTIDLETADGRLIAGLLAQVDQAEIERTSERLRRVFRDGKPGGRRRAFGYTADGTAIEADEAALIRDAVQRIIARTTTPYRVAMEWNDADVRTTYGNVWRPNKLKRMLGSPHLAGIAKERSRRPAIITEDEHRLVVAAMEEVPRLVKRDSRGRVASPGRPSGRRYALLRLATCRICGETLSGHSGGYFCPDGHLSIRATMLERWVAEIAERQAPSPKPAAREASADTAPLLARLRRLDEQYAEVEAALSADEMPVRTGGRMLVKIDEERAEVQSALADTLPALQPGAGFEGILKARYAAPPTQDFVKRWRARALTDAEVARLQDWFRALIDRVVVSKAPRGRWSPIEDRVEVVWRADAGAARID